MKYRASDCARAGNTSGGSHWLSGAARRMLVEGSVFTFSNLLGWGAFLLLFMKLSQKLSSDNHNILSNLSIKRFSNFIYILFHTNMQKTY